MTRLLTLVLCTFLMTSAFAGTPGYSLKIDFILNGKLVSSPHILARKGEKARITQPIDKQLSFIEVTADEGEVQGVKGILLKFIIGVIDKDGKGKILSKPQILARENQKAEVNSVSDKQNIMLSVVAVRKSLKN